MKSYGVTIHMKVTTSLLLNKCSPPSVPPIQCSNVGKQQNNYAHKHLVLYNIGSGSGGVGGGGGEEGQKEVKSSSLPNTFDYQ